jgi:hypothetical protein
MTPAVVHHWIRQGPTWIIATGVAAAIVIATLVHSLPMLDVLKWLAGIVVAGKAIETATGKRGDATRREP